MICQPGYTNFQTEPKCENLGSTALESMNVLGTIKILLDDSAESLTPMNSRCSIKRCIVCHPNTFGALEFCIKCNYGYYPEILTGKCELCIMDRFCRTCSRQNRFYKDNWKWDIRNYYRTFIDIGGYHSFTTSSMRLSVLDYELICTSCKSGYLLYKGNCIKDCEKGCQNCQIIDGKSECV